jgi:hypothetical protein
MRLRGACQPSSRSTARRSSSVVVLSIWLCAERGDSREREGEGEGEREGEVHTHYLEPAKECALAASAIVGCSTLGFASRPSARTLTMDPAEEGAGSERRSATTTEVGVEEAQAELHGGAHGDS